jgi:uncharacterized protein (DUF302 family)
MNAPGGAPLNVTLTEGIHHRQSAYTVDQTVERLTAAIHKAGAKVFAVVDHSGEAQRAGQSLRDTKLLIFGNPAAGTALMRADPLVAIDLPLKVLVWADELGAVWMTYLSQRWLADRHGVPPDLAPRLAAPDVLAGQVGSSG